MKIPTRRFVWFDHVSTDLRRAQRFYGELFGWKTQPNDDYAMIALGEELIGGYMNATGAEPYAHWLSYLQVDNAHEAAKRAASLGANVLEAPTSVDEVGTMVLISDPRGARLALWQPSQPKSGDYTGKDGAWIWNELYTDDIDAAGAFYKALSGFHVKTMTIEGGSPDRYDILDADGKGRAGILTMPGVPTHWMPYVKVADVDRTLDHASRMGAIVKAGPEDVPNVGRIAVFLDPQGAPLGILRPSPM